VDKLLAKVQIYFLKNTFKEVCFFESRSQSPQAACRQGWTCAFQGAGRLFACAFSPARLLLGAILWKNE
jgi:hypothetical protein